MNHMALVSRGCVRRNTLAQNFSSLLENTNCCRGSDQRAPGDFVSCGQEGTSTEEHGRFYDRNTLQPKTDTPKDSQK